MKHLQNSIFTPDAIDFLYCIKVCLLFYGIVGIMFYLHSLYVATINTPHSDKVHNKL